jgi:hypothetical protein
LAISCECWNSAQSTLITARGSPNKISAAASTMRVLPEPVGPRNNRFPTGRPVELIPAQKTWYRSTSARTPSSWPTTLLSGRIEIPATPRFSVWGPVVVVTGDCCSWPFSYRNFRSAKTPRCGARSNWSSLTPTVECSRRSCVIISCPCFRRVRYIQQAEETGRQVEIEGAQGGDTSF